jgi:hypothetical protein
MSIIGSNILAGASGQAGGGGGGGAYEISRSVRLNAPNSAYLSRTPASSGNRKTWTWAGWVKRSALSNNFALFSAESGSSYTIIGFRSGNSIDIELYDGATDTNSQSTSVFRDTSAWYHVVVVLNTTAATASNRVVVYVNNVSQSLSTFPAQNTTALINAGVSHNIGRYSGARYFSGYLADIHFIDGQALTPSSFGQTDTNGVWQPKAYTGTYGTNGFKLNFADNSNTTAATLGKDLSGNANNWTPNNFSITAGAGNDSLVDVPTAFGTDTGAGGEVRGNYCTLNPLVGGANSGQITFANGNLDATWSAANNYAVALGSMGVDSGKWYWETRITGNGGYWILGIALANVSLTNYMGGDASGYSYYSLNGTKYNDNASSSYGSSYTTNDIIGIAFDADNGKVFFAKNGTWQASGNPVAGTNAAFTGLTGRFFPAYTEGTQSVGAAYSCNFGQRPFAYTAPSGFKALCTTNLPEPTIADGSTVMDVALYTGNGSTQTISGLNFSPDFLWIKSRSTAQDNNVFDAVRGVAGNYYALQTNATSAEGQYGTVSALTSDGFTLSNGGGATNFNGTSYTAWAWDAGSSTVTNTEGSITSQVRANASAGFSIVTWTSSPAGTTVGHGLGVTPSIILYKRRDSAQDWYFETNIIDGSYDYLVLNSTAAKVDGGSSWSTRATSTTISSFTGTAGLTYVAYCFAPVAGYSSFGSYTGNGSTDGPFVYTGFRPRWILIKQTNTGRDWRIYDTSRNAYNLVDLELYPNAPNAEATANGMDLLSNGFKFRSSGVGVNTSGGTYIYAAFASHPLATARAR